MIRRDCAWEDVRNLLVVRLDNIGDILMTGPALRAIKETLPRSHLTLLASPAGTQAAPLLPWVDDVFTWRVLWQDLGHLPFDPAREWALIEDIRQRRFHAAIIFTSFSQSPYPPALACSLAGIPLRLGDSKENAEGPLTHFPESLPDHVHQVERNLHLTRTVGFDTTHKEICLKLNDYCRRTVDNLLSHSGIRNDEPYLLLAPWASASARTYATHRFGLAALDVARAAGMRVVIAGAERDRARGSKELSECLGDRAVNLVGMTTVGELAVLVERATLVMTNNTSALHFADALGTPVVVLYSGTDHESQWRPRRTPHRLLRRATGCSPCYAFTCPTQLECLDFSHEEVATAALELLNAFDRSCRWRAGEANPVFIKEGLHA